MTNNTVVKCLLIAISACVFALTGMYGQVGIGTTVPDSSAMLEVQSTDRGFLPPRMTTTQRNNISAPQPGLTIYNTESNCIEWWNGEGWFNACIGAIDTTIIYPPETVHCDPDNPTEVVEVMNPATGRIWMDRNLGASQVATSSTDEDSYGDLYQWGRFADGHQCRNSATTTTLSSSDQPGHGDFILAPDEPRDWRSPQNDNLWQGVNGVNNPCPDGYRIPTSSEWVAEFNSWNSQDLDGAFESLLKLPIAGFRNFNNGQLAFGAFGYYWTSIVSESQSQNLFFSSTNATILSNNRGFGRTVRCIKDESPLQGTIESLDCESFEQMGTVTEGEEATGVSVEVIYEGGNGGSYDGQVVASEGVNELTATLDSGDFEMGIGSLVYEVSGTPDSSGMAFFALEIGGQSCTLEIEVLPSSPAYPTGTVHCDPDNPTEVDEVMNPATGRIWMDRNLGASRVAQSSTDSMAYGDLYQWGRFADGHQCRYSTTTTTLSSTDQPGHGDFIIAPDAPVDWRSPQNDNLWQGVNGINNPCPSGYRLPTETEWEDERNSWNANNATGAFASPIKLPIAGFRGSPSGSLLAVGTGGYYWSSTVSSTNSLSLLLNSSIATMGTSNRARGHSVRCLKD